MSEKYYFLSDAHIGTPLVPDVKQHELKLVAWLDMAASDATAIFLMGDIFDFWFEYRATVPKGFTRLLGKLRELTERGLPIHFFTGNHDVWTFGYLEQECGLVVHRDPITLSLCGKVFFLAHGDGLGDDDHAFRLIRYIFHSKTCQWIFRTLVPPYLGLHFGYAWSKHNRQKHGKTQQMLPPHLMPEQPLSPPFRGEENEPLVIFAKKHAAIHHAHYYIVGHRHIVLNLMLDSQSQLVILGDFMHEFSYATFDGTQLCIENFE